jgi:hypothetical protein
MKTTIVLAVLLAATPAFAQSSGGPGAPGATTSDYKLGSHHKRATKKSTKHVQAAPTQKPAPAATAPAPTAAAPPAAAPLAAAPPAAAPGTAGGGVAKQPMGRP